MNIIIEFPISVGTKFQLKLTVLIFGANLSKKNIPIENRKGKYYD